MSNSKNKRTARKGGSDSSIDWSILDMPFPAGLSTEKRRLFDFAKELKLCQERLDRYKNYWPRTINMVTATLNKALEADFADGVLKNKAKGLLTVLGHSKLDRNDVHSRHMAICQYVINQLKEIKPE